MSVFCIHEGLVIECIGSNIQTAIDDLGDNGGTVWVGSSVTINSPIRPKNYIHIDFQGNMVFLGGDFSFLNVTSCQYATVRNVNVYLSEYQTEPVIILFIPHDGGWPDRIRYNTFENINMIHHDSHWISGYGYREHNFTGIKLEINSVTNMLYNTFSNIKMRSGLIGIHLESSASSSPGYCSGNYFENIWIDSFVTSVEFDAKGAYFKHNVFEDIKTQTVSYSIDGFKNISGTANHFMNCLVWDWFGAVNTNGHEWSISDEANKTVILAHFMTDDILDEGYNTKIL